MYENEVKETKNNYKKWLEMSHMKEEDLLQFKTANNFTILTGEDKGYSIIIIGNVHNGKFEKIGEQFVYKTGDTETFLDVSILLFYIAQRLDEANEKLPKFQQRERYFYLKVKEFVNDEKKMILQ